MDFNPIDKNNKLNKELSTNEEISLKTRLFTFFYYILRKKDINLLLCSVFLFFESVQIISYAFSDPHTPLWKIDTDTMHYIQLVVTSPRIAPLMTFLTFNWYIIIYACLLGYVFIHCLTFAMTLRFNKVTSKFYQLSIGITRYFTSGLTIFLLIPISELLLLMVKCDDNNKVSLVSEPIECWKGLHILYAFLSIIFVSLFYFLIILITIFYFDPFNSKKTATKIDTTADTFLYIFKMVMVVRFISLSNDWISIVVMVIGSLLNLKRAYENPTYNNFVLECIISIRNAAVFWTYLVLLICKILETSTFNGQIFLLLMGYPLIITVSIIYYRRKSQNFLISNSNFNDAGEFLIKLKYFKQLIESFLSKNKSSKSNKSNTVKKNEILLKGYITIHEETCIAEECPLKKFMNNYGNFNIQKTSLLHYMNILFNEGIKKFPNSRVIIMNFVQFNYEKKYNLNAAKTYLAKLDKSKNTLTEDYVIFSIKQNISSSNNKFNRSISGDEELIRLEDTIEHKFRRLKFLVETATKLYGEFWGSLATNLTNNLNLKKLFFVGNRLNQFLLEINQLWENDLKNKKIDIENQSIVQLYAYFLREILKNKKRSEEITKKLNEEQHYESRKTEGDKLDVENLDLILENQDYIIYCRTNEKGECTIIQCSNSVISLLGHTKQELIGRKIETLMPSIYLNDHAKMLAFRIKAMRTTFASHKDNFRSSDKKQIFILPKTKVGYLIPVNARFTIYNDDDFSNTYIIKSKFEIRDTKSVYAFYILTKEDFTVDSISSSALNLGLSMDLLKKHVINLNRLVRSENWEEMVLGERYADFEEEPKKVIWVSPEKIYPKNEIKKINEEDIEPLIQASPRKPYNLLITKMKYKDEEPLGYCFRFTEIDTKKNNEVQEIKPNSKRLLLYDMMNLNYIRTILVTNKTNKNESILNSNPVAKEFARQPSIRKDAKKKRKTTDRDELSEEDEEEEKHPENNLLSKDKIQEYTGKGSDEIKGFINNLVFYGSDVTLIKKRNTKEEYNWGKGIASLISIVIDEFLTRINERNKNNPEKKHEGKRPEGASTSSTNVSTTESFSGMDYISDTSASLSNIFNEKSVTYIKLFSFAFFLCLCAIISAEFSISLSIVQDSNSRMFYADKAFKILNGLLYTKFFVTEAILAQSASYKNIDSVFKGNNTAYILDMMKEMSYYRQLISDTYSFFSNATVTFSDEYTQYVSNTQVNIRTLSNGLMSNEHQPFQTAMSRIPTTIFYVSTVNDNYQRINMSDRNAYELMMNLLNDYLLVWRDVTFILVKDVKSHTISDNRLLFIFGFSFLISIVSVIGIWKLINRFIDDREKPVDLFLTIKKQKFEELKASSESFLNKLLNKFFGNEEAEEETMIDYSTGIKSEDIMITKFKTKNEYKQSIRTSSEYLLIFIKIVIFFFIIQAYMGFKYFYIDNAMKDMNQFTDVFNITHYSQSDLVLRIDVTKQYYYSTGIPIFNDVNTLKQFTQNLKDISESVERLMIITYSNMNYLSKTYMTDFYNKLNGNITSIVPSSLTSDSFLGTLNYGFKSVIVRFFELIRFIGIQFFKEPTYDYINAPELGEADDILRNVIRPWYNSLLEELLTSFSDYVNQLSLINVSTFIVLIVSIIIMYCLVWKSYEEKLKELLKTSVDLINLIPEEIKFQIVQKINEEEEKKE